MRRAILLDRDGVINAMVYNADFGLVDSPARPEEFHLMPGAAKAIKRINELGFLAIVISNQPGIAKGKFTAELLESTFTKMHDDLAQEGARLDAVYYCLHHPDAALTAYRKNCECRKPKPGMLLQAAADWDIDLSESYFVGDGITDIAAGQSAGCKTFLLNSRKCYICDELARQKIEPDFIGKDLADAVQAIEQFEADWPGAEEKYAFRCQLNS